MKVTVAGAGPGAKDLFSTKLEKIIADSDVVLTSGRLVESALPLNSNTVEIGVIDTIKYIEKNKNKDEKVCVLATGDTGFHSIAKTISREVGDSCEVDYFCGISSMSYFAACNKMSYENMKLISLHGTDGSIVPHVCYTERVFTLTGGKISVSTIIEQLIEAEMTEVMIHVGENLSLEDESIRHGTPLELSSEKFGPLAVVIIENKNFTDSFYTLEDEDFLRAKVPMTKKAVRNLAAAELSVRPSEVVYDIGAGTGAMTCVLALKAKENFVYAIEKNKEAVELIKQNMKKLGIKNIKLVEGEAPLGMEAFPPADKVFIGGTKGNLKDIVDIVLKANPKAVILVTAVTLETLNEATELFNNLGLKKEIMCANISMAQRLGNYDLMKAENPVYLIKGAI